jgi:hypothetical protein
LSPFVPVPFGISWDKGREIGDKWGQVGTSGDTWGQMGTRRDKILKIFFLITENFSGDLGRGLYTFILSQGLDWT